MTKFLTIALALGLLIGAAAMYVLKPEPDVPQVAAAPAAAVTSAGAGKKDEGLRGIGFFKSGGGVTVILSDGTVHTAQSFTKSTTGEWRAQLSSGVVVQGVEK